MDKMCKKSEPEDLNKSIKAAGETERVNCGSPVFKCVTQTKPVRENFLDSSDYDIPSYQVNQSVKSRISSKYYNEANDSVLPFSPVFSPIPVVPTPQLEPSVRSLGAVGQSAEKSAHTKTNTFSISNNKESFKPGSIFESLGMVDKDISWVSSMASPPPMQVPGSELNTVEKATFLPEENFRSIQPRALFSPTFDDDFGCQPIVFTSESDEDDDDEAYKSVIRLSDVCATLNQLEVKSLDQGSNNSEEKIVFQNDSVISPVIRAKKKKSESVKKKKKGILVVSPTEKDKYEFLVGENLKVIESDKVKSNDGSNFIEDDSFQSISFTCIDELCKTLVTDPSDSFLTAKTSESDETLVNCINSNSKPSDILKKFYSTKVKSLVQTVSSIDNLHSNAKALEEGNKCIPAGNKIDQFYADKGIVRFDIFSKEPSKSDAIKRLHSEVTEEKDESIEKKFRKVNDENSDWGNVKQYLSESQLNVSDGEIFKTVENLEKTLASQENKEMEKLSGKSLQDEKSLSSQDSTLKVFAESSGKSQEEEFNLVTKHNIETSETFDGRDSSKGVLEMHFPAFTTASGSKISVSEKSLNKAREILKDCENLENFSSRKFEDYQGMSDKELQAGKTFLGFSTCSGKEIKITAEALEKARTFMLKCEASESSLKQSQVHYDEIQDKLWNSLIKSFSLASGIQKPTPSEALEKVSTLLKSDESLKKQPGNTAKVMGDFLSASDQKIRSSEKDLEKTKNTAPECDDQTERRWMSSFTTGTGKLIKVSAQSLEKARALMSECEEKIWELPSISTSTQIQNIELKVNDEQKLEVKPSMFKGFSTGSGKIIEISAKALEKAKSFMKNCEKEFNESFNITSNKELSDKTLETKAKAETCEKLLASEEHYEMPKISFSTALGKQVRVSAEALEKAKAFWSKSDDCAMKVPDNMVKNLLPVEERPNAEVNKIKDRCDQNKPEFFDSNINRLKTPERNPETIIGKKEPVKPETLEIDESDDWDEIIPSWLHVYTTSPSMISDELELSPFIAHEVEKSCEPYNEDIKSPVLGPNDRFYGKTKKRNFRFTEKTKNQFVNCNKGTNPKTSVKRALNLNFSVPFKKMKVAHDFVETGVKEERARARVQQEKIIKEKQKVTPLEGSLLRKKRSERQMSWMEAVAKASPEAHSDEVLKSLGVSEDVLEVNIQNSSTFKFNGERYFGSAECLKNTKGISAGDDCCLILDDENKLGIEEFKRAFLASPGVQPNLLPAGWVENHYKWIIWKLAHYEKSFPLYFGGICLTPNHVLLQMKYRYDREIDRNERSALKKILERDDSSLKRLVLCICGIKKVTVNETIGYELELSDGWYSCPAHTDLAMSRLIEEGKLSIGMKVMTQGAVLVNCEQGASPLEISKDVYLRISTNSTRRVRWDTKLGFQKNPENFPISLGSILARGGPISRVDVITVRIYPMLYMEKTDGHHVTRNRRTEEKVDAEYRRIQEQQLEIIYSEILSEIRRSSNFEKSNKNNYEEGDGLCQLLEDPIALQTLMLTDQRKFLEKLQSNDLISRELIQKIEKKLEKEKLKKRIVSQFLRVKVVDFRKPDYNNPALLSVWNADEDLSSLLTEGKVVSIMNVTINSSARLYKPLQINTTRQTQFRPILKNVKYPARMLTQLKNVSSKVCPAFEEVDLVGMVALIQDVSYGSRLSQVVYLTDLEMNFVGIVFWGSCKDFGWENMLRIKAIVACSNLHWKKNYTHQEVPSVYVNENSVFTENPKQGYLKEEIERLKQNLPQDITVFLSKCEEELTTKLEDSKWRTNTSKNSSNDSRENLSSKPRITIDGGFESKPTASSTPIKPFISKSNSSDVEPSPIQKRIEKLQSYGEPSPLIPLLVRNNMKRKFKKRQTSE